MKPRKNRRLQGSATLQSDIIMNLLVVVLGSVSVVGFVPVEPFAAEREATDDTAIDEDSEQLLVFLEADGTLRLDALDATPVHLDDVLAALESRGAAAVTLVEDRDTPAVHLHSVLAAVAARTRRPPAIACFDSPAASSVPTLDRETSP